MNLIKLLIFSFLCCILLVKSKYSETEIKTESLKELKYSIKKVNKEYIIRAKYDKEAIANCVYEKGYHKDGWGKLYIKSNKNFDDITQSYAVGYLEGYITQEKIYQHYMNMRLNSFSKENGFPKNMKKFFKENLTYMDELAKSNPEDIHSQTAIKIHTQYKGMVDGYNANSSKKENINIIDFHMVASDGDLDEISFYEKEKTNLFNQMSAEELVAYKHKHSHCTALIRINEDFSDVFIGHNTWTEYSSGNRILKTYEFHFNDDERFSKSVSFSSYPGKIGSTDDFFVTSNNLVIQETTNSVLNEEILKKITPKAYLNWIRTMIANRLSTNSEEWIENFVEKNSGTYNNQYMIIDMKLIDFENKTLKSKAFMINEQMPGKTITGDMTESLLEKKYWPSFNTPYFPEVRREFGYDELLARFKTTANKKDEFMINTTLNYEDNDRHNIIKRDVNKVNSLEDMKTILRYNDYKNDKESIGRPGFSLAGRFDLDHGVQRMCMGAIDAKVASVK